MLTIITQIIFCIISASILGFIIGWIFSSFLRNEKHQLQILTANDILDEKKEKINQLQTDMDARDREIEILQQEYTTIQKEMLSYSLDQKDDSLLSKKYKELLSENKMLIGQIKEQQICENENELLQSEIKQLSNEKVNLSEKIKELEEFKISYKDNIHKIAELESKQQKVDIKKVEKNFSNPKSINNTICKDKQIIDKNDLKSAGLTEDKLSKLLNELFLNKGSLA